MIKRYLIAQASSVVMFTAVTYGTTTHWKTAIGLILALTVSLILICWSLPENCR